MLGSGGFAGRENRKMALQIDTVTCAVTGKEGREAERVAKRQKANTANGSEMGSISGPNGDNRHSSLFFCKPLIFPVLFFFQNSRAKFTKTGADVPEKPLQNGCNAAEDSQETCYTSSTVNVVSSLQ